MEAKSAHLGFRPTFTFLECQHSLQSKMGKVKSTALFLGSGEVKEILIFEEHMQLSYVLQFLIFTTLKRWACIAPFYTYGNGSTEVLQLVFQSHTHDFVSCIVSHCLQYHTEDSVIRYMIQYKTV